jgi:hypothetical protein
VGWLDRSLQFNRTAPPAAEPVGENNQAPPAEPEPPEQVEEPPAPPASDGDAERESLWVSTWAAATVKQVQGDDFARKPPAQRRAELRQAQKAILAGGVFSPDLQQYDHTRNPLLDPAELQRRLGREFYGWS